MKPSAPGTSLIKQTSAWLPLLMSLAALTLILVYVVLYYPLQERAGDESGFAHAFQLLMLLQLPFILWFVIKWLPKDPGQTLRILGLQSLAWFGAVGLIYWLEK